MLNIRSDGRSTLTCLGLAEDANAVSEDSAHRQSVCASGRSWPMATIPVIQIESEQFDELQSSSSPARAPPFA